MNGQTSSWYEIQNIEAVDSPALVVYPDRVAENIVTCIDIAGDKERLRPHVKTHKVGQVAKMHIDHGITRFKCATIAEAEMLADASATEVLLAHQPVGPKKDRIIALATAFPKTTFGFLVDNEETLTSMEAKAAAAGATLQAWIDINNGMNRSGIEPGPAALALYKAIIATPSLTPGGLHVYDGHFRQSLFDERQEASDAGFQAVYLLLDKLKADGIKVPAVVAGGSPTFPVHALRAEIELSPGTYVYWDAGYGEKFPDMPFKHA
ncbi:MAG: alanine racemase, partial [Chloroflexota bacterium]